MAVAAQPREVDAAAGGGVSWERPVQWGVAILAAVLIVFALAFRPASAPASARSPATA